MYTQHWKLSCRPFENRCDAAFYYPAELHQAAVLKLHYTIENRRSAALLCGPTGIGKTFLIQALRKQLGPAFRDVTNLVFPALEPSQWLCYFVDALDAAQSGSSTNTSSALTRFEKILLGQIEAKKHPTIIVDEAHLLEHYNLLEPLRLLLNVAADRAPGEAAWTLVLVGQEVARLKSNVIRRSIERLQLNAWSSHAPRRNAQLHQHRPSCWRRCQPDLPKAMHSKPSRCLSQGLPRRINRLCDLALMLATPKKCLASTPEVIDSVHADLAAPM